MSFRKRSDIIGGGSSAVPGRAPLGIGRAPVGSGAIPGRTPAHPRLSINSRIPVNPRTPNASVSRDSGFINGRTQSPQVEVEEISALKNPSVRPSLISSQPTVSTGTGDLDKLLLHQGLPLGHSLLVEESGTTDFASVILRAFVSQGIMHNRINKDQINSHVIAVGISTQWTANLPGLYKGSSKDQKKAKILANESKVSVSNLATSTAGVTSRVDNDLKIAWRYGVNSKQKSASPEPFENSAYEYYINQFDITQKLAPGPNAQDISFVPVGLSHIQLIQQIQSIIQRHVKLNPAIVIRIAIPGLLNPTGYNPLSSSPTFLYPFVHSLRAILRQYSQNVVLVASLSSDLYPRDSNVAHVLESLADSCIHLQPFNQEMTQLIERAYKNEPSKIQQGLVNIVKLPVLSEKGMMMIHEGEYAFKNGRKKFEIEEWGIPVEDSEKEEHTTAEGGTTKKNLDF